MVLVGMIVLFIVAVVIALWIRRDADLNNAPTGNLHFFDDCPYEGCDDCIDLFE